MAMAMMIDHNDQHYAQSALMGMVIQRVAGKRLNLARVSVQKAPSDLMVAWEVLTDTEMKGDSKIEKKMM